MKKVTSSTYRKDKYYDSISKAVNILLKRCGFVSPAELFIEIGNLKRENYEKWRFRKIPYLERVIICNLNVIARKMKVLYCIARDMGLKASRTVYNSWGKGAKVLLRFSKYGSDHVERLYSTHYTSRMKNHGQEVHGTGEGENIPYRGEGGTEVDPAM